MRLHILSDLHLEFGPIDIPPTNADVVVLAGDVHVGTNGLGWIRAKFQNQQVVYVLGNHEFYHNNLTGLTESLRGQAEGSSVHLLENSVVEVGGYTFLGCTLWTDFALVPNPKHAMAAAERLINDYRIVQVGGVNRILRAQDTVEMHRESVAWLRSQLARNNPARTVVVTHHAPSPLSEAPGYRQGLLSPSFVSDLNALVEQSGIPLWIHGHTHHNVDYQLGATRVLTNQRGYPREICAGFDPGMVIELESAAAQ
jgi:predicted phosphodiesterase